MRRYDEWLQDQGQTEFRAIEPSDMPQDPDGSGKGWRFEVLEHGGSEHDAMPQWIEATDADGRSAIYTALDPANPADRPQDQNGAGRGWTFLTREQDGNNVPQTIIGRDPEGREAIYSPLRHEGVVGKWELVRPPV
jgi:hypothetical protein